MQQRAGKTRKPWLAQAYRSGIHTAHEMIDLILRGQVSLTANKPEERGVEEGRSGEETAPSPPAWYVPDVVDTVLYGYSVVRVEKMTGRAVQVVQACSGRITLKTLAAEIDTFRTNIESTLEATYDGVRLFAE